MKMLTTNQLRVGLILSLLMHFCVGFSQINQDSVIQLIQSESVDSARLEHIITAISEFDMEDALEVESYFNQGLSLANDSDPLQVMELYSKAGDKLHILNEFDLASKKYNQLHELAIKYRSKKYQAIAMLGSATILSSDRKFDEEKSLLYEALELVSDGAYPKVEAPILLQLATVERGLGNLKEALLHINKSGALYLQENNFNKYIESLNIKGRTFRSLGEYDSARVTYAKAIKIAIDKKEDLLLSKAYNNLGNISQLTGDIEGALSYYVKSLEIKEKMGDKRGIALAHHNVGSVKIGLRRHKDAIANFRKSNIQAKEIDYLNLVRLNELKIGSVYNEMQQLDSAIIYHNRSLEIAEEIKDKRGIALCYINLGEDYSKRKEYNKAFRYFTDALNIAKETNNLSYQGAALSYIATTYLDTKKDEENSGSTKLESTELSNSQIEGYLLEAKKIADDIGNFENKETALSGLNKLYTANKNYKLKSEVLDEYVALKDSIFSKERTKAIADWETKYETAEKEKEITILEATEEKSAARIRLWSAISIFLFSIIGIGSYLFIQLQKARNKLTLRNEELYELNQTKDRFFGIIAHDIRSPIVALESVNEQIEYYIKKDYTEKLIQLGGLVGKTTRHLNSLLDNLLNWALVQTKSMPYHPEMIDVTEAWKETAELMHANAQVKHIELVSEIPSNLRVYADFRSFSTILRNLISNALKFSKPNKAILFKASKEERHIKFEVIDQGIGMSEELVAKLFSLEKKSKKGTAGEKGTGLGLILCKDLVELNQGNIGVESVEGKGSIFCFTIPHPSS